MSRERTTFLIEHWAGEVLTIAVWSPELEVGLWATWYPVSGRQQHFFEAAPPEAIAFMGHPDPASEQRAARWTRPHTRRLLRSLPTLSPLLSEAAQAGLTRVITGRDAEQELDILRADPDGEGKLCRRDSDCGQAWTGHLWIVVSPPGASEWELFHLNLNSGQIVPPTPVLLR